MNNFIDRDKDNYIFLESVLKHGLIIVNGFIIYRHILEEGINAKFEYKAIKRTLGDLKRIDCKKINNDFDKKAVGSLSPDKRAVLFFTSDSFIDIKKQCELYDGVITT